MVMVEPGGELSLEVLKNELESTAPSPRRRAIEQFTLAALGSIPWVGGFVSAAAMFKFQEATVKQDDLQTRWLAEHQAKLERLNVTLEEVTRRFEALGPEIDGRIQSEAYLDLVRRSFRAWDRADTDQKRKYLGLLVSNAAGTRLVSDDVLRLFIDWLDLYHEAHLAVIRQIFQGQKTTRREIWTSVYGPVPREDSAEADLFRMLIRDLSTGGVIRQERETDGRGQFLRQAQKGRTGPASPVLETSFNDTKPYVLTELGKQFVHYAMNEVVPRLGSGPGTE